MQRWRSVVPILILGLSLAGFTPESLPARESEACWICSYRALGGGQYEHLDAFFFANDQHGGSLHSGWTPGHCSDFHQYYGGES